MGEIRYGRHPLTINFVKIGLVRETVRKWHFILFCTFFVADLNNIRRGVCPKQFRLWLSVHWQLTKWKPYFTDRRKLICPFLSALIFRVRQIMCMMCPHSAFGSRRVSWKSVEGVSLVKIGWGSEFRENRLKEWVSWKSFEGVSFVKIGWCKMVQAHAVEH
jgi:hypothetical protein